MFFPEATTPLAEKPTTSPVKFFIHHVSHSPQQHHSPHVIDLKQHTSPFWENIQTVKPEISKTPRYHFYHEPTPEKIGLIAPVLKSPKSSRSHHWQSLAENINEKKENFQHNLAEAKNDLFRWIKRRFPLKRLAIAATALLAVAIIPTGVRTYYHELRNTTDKIADSSTAGFLALQESTSAILAAELPSAQKSLVNALENFDTAVSEMQNNHQILQKIATLIPLLGTEVQSRQKLITAGQKMAMGNTYLLKGISESQANPELNLTDRLAIIIAHLQAALPNYEKALADFNQVEINSLPFEYQEAFGDFKTLFTSLVGDFRKLSALGSSLQEIFGGQGLRRYLLVFQNPHEIRPTGGFMGSFAIMEIKDGQIIKMEVPTGGSYDLQGQLNEYLEPPAPLLIANRRWEFQDANWFPDFPASSEKILWFYQHARDYTADGVIAINATVLERLLSIVGPLTDAKRNITLTADNAVSTLQKIVENGPEKQERKPKQILADLAPQFISYFQNFQPTNAMPILVNLEEALEQKEIQVYFTAPQTEATVKSLGWGGQILPTGELQDYIMVVNSNIRGQKSDAQIKQTISHQAVIAEGGSIIDTVLIKREHTGSAGEKLYGQVNIDYLRLYVPLGSQLISASGFTWPDEASFKAPENYYKKDATLQQLEKEVGIHTESGTRITEEFNKTAFGNWVITEPGQISQVQFTYRLPFKATVTKNARPTESWKNIFVSGERKNIRYQLVAQKQSGVESELESQIIFPTSWESIWREGSNLTLAANGALISPMILSRDMVWSLIVQDKTTN